MTPLIDGNSFWIETTPTTATTPLAGDAEADVCIVGGGITGLLCAWELLEAGRSVVVLERARIAGSVTGYTTAKLSSQHGMRYGRLTRDHGADAAREYGQANERGLARVRHVARELGIDADIEERDSYVYATDPESVDALHAEADAASAAGLPASFTTDVPLPFPTVGGVRFTGQAQFHPRRLLLPLATELVARGATICEDSKATEVARDGDGWAVTCDAGRVRAASVVVATLLPSAGVGSDLYAHLYCHQGYAVALPLLEGDGPDGVLISYERPMRSIRTIPSGDGRLLQVGGAAHVTDPNSGNSPCDDLEAWAREHFPVGEAQYRWTTQDYSSADGMPLIGPIEDGLFVATGFGGWGLTTASVAAGVIRSHVADGGESEAVARLFDPRRTIPEATDEVVSSHTSSGTDRDAAEAVQALAPGSAAVVRAGGEQLGAYRDAEGELHVVSAVCTHLRGIVLWDPADTTWTCPCHGSKFAPSGEVCAGPAKEPLADRRELVNVPDEQ